MQTPRASSSTSATPWAAPAAALPKSDIILSNPPFGTAKGGGGPTRDDFTHSHQQQAARLRAAHLSAPQGRRPRRRRPARQRAVRSRRRRRHPARPDGQVQSAHPPAPAHRHLLRPGRQDQRAVLRQKISQRPPAAPRKCGSTTCAPTCPKFGKRTPLTRAHFAEFEAA
jgi:type I restriction enzyme M protein